MKINRTTILVIVGVLLVLFGIGKYNAIVGQEETIEQSWADVETQYQRRADLIPNLVEVVKGASDYERETLTQVIEARSKATSIQLNADDLSEENIAKFQEAQDQLSGALSRLLVSVERYPDLKANANYRDLQVQLEGTENRIGVARTRFNESVVKYNRAIKTFPGNVFAGIFGFDAHGYFHAESGAENAPNVSFE